MTRQIHTWVNGTPATQVSVHDRGLQFGDGLFETMRLENGLPEDFDAHLQRMQTGAKRLGITFPAGWSEEIINCCTGYTGVLKLMLTRGEAGAGLRLLEKAACTRIVKISPLPAHIQTWQREGVRLQICATPLSCNPATAGLKLLNWLEPALAYLELAGEADEGLMCNLQGEVIEGTSSNFFAYKDGVLYTPSLENCGLPGVTRAKLITQARAAGLSVEEVSLRPEDLATMQACFVTNSVVGVCPVRQIDAQYYDVQDIKHVLDAH